MSKRARIHKAWIREITTANKHAAEAGFPESCIRRIQELHPEKFFHHIKYAQTPKQHWKTLEKMVGKRLRKWYE